MKQQSAIYLFVLFIVFLHTNTYGSKIGKWVLANPTDPYYSLAEEIAEHEKIGIIHEFSEIKNYNIEYLLWVIAPQNLTEKNMLEYSKTIYEDNLAVVMGIISGKDITLAKELWAKNYNLNNKKRIVLTAEMKNTKVPANVSVYNGSTKKTLPLTKENILNNLSGAGYIQVNMHGAAQSWFCEKTGISVSSSDISNLNGAIIESKACNNFIPWNPNSMLNKSIENGAIAYTGFVYSPISGSQLGAKNGSLFLNTWKDFTVGHVVQVQNKAAIRNYAKIPHCFLMGNPDIHLSNQKPYELVKDSLFSNGKRTVHISNCKKGFLPIIINGGAKYSYVELSSGISHWDNSVFLNRDIEMINLGKDKYVLVKNDQADFVITLSGKISILNRIKSATKNFLYTKILRRHQDGFYLILGIIFLIILGIQIIRKKIPQKIIGVSILTAMFFLGFSILVDLIFINKISVTSKVLQFNINNYLGMFFLFLAGSVIFLKSKNVRKKIWAVILIISPMLLSVVLLSVISIVKVLFLASNFSIQKTSYFLGVSFIFDIIFSASLVFFVLKAIQKWVLVKI